MIRLATIVLGLGLGLPALAAPQMFFDAVHKSPAMQKVLDAASGQNTDVISIQHTATYRCPGCYQFKMKYYKDATRNEEMQTAVFQTKLKHFGGSEILVFDKTSENPS